MEKIDVIYEELKNDYEKKIEKLNNTLEKEKSKNIIKSNRINNLENGIKEALKELDTVGFIHAKGSKERAKEILENILR